MRLGARGSDWSSNQAEATPRHTNQAQSEAIELARSRGREKQERHTRWLPGRKVYLSVAADFPPGIQLILINIHPHVLLKR